jgi:deoxyribonuclease V
MKARNLHPWRVSHAQACAIQERLRLRLKLSGRMRAPRTVAAADVAYSRLTHNMYAAVVVCDAATLEPVAKALAVRKARFPYIPGLFSFREVPPLLATFAKLKLRPDVVLFDGQGQAHPRRFGLACHAGLVLNVPTIGCAKSRLVGTHDAVGDCAGDWAAVHDGTDIVGAALRTRAGTKPVYVSIGHRIDLANAIELVQSCVRRYRLPEPLRFAHQATTDLMRRTEATAHRPRTRGYPDFIAAGS